METVGIIYLPETDPEHFERADPADTAMRQPQKPG
jgi:hypothetical protein